MGSISSCGSCGHPYLTPVINLGSQPLAERDNGERYPLKLLKCDNCTLVQLSFIPDQGEVFPLDHPYATGNTKALRDHFSGLAVKIADTMTGDYLAVDIGANDGTLLKAIQRESCGTARLAAVEPTNQARKCRDHGFRTWQQFFTPETARDILHVCGPARVVTACNVLAHVPDPHEFLEGVKILLDDDGVFITENHDWASIANGLQIDTIYHEHLRYYSPASLSYLLSKNGFTISEIKSVNTHGGSFRTAAVKERNQISRRAVSARNDLRLVLATARTKGKIYGVGACTRATPLIHYAKLNDYLSCVVEVPESEKIGTFMPGTRIPVVDEKKLIEDQPPYALLFAWHWASTIVPKLREKGYKGKFIIPLPEARIYHG